jgi:hypothetical protein
MTRDRYQTRLAKFLDFIGMVGTTLEERAKAFAKTGKDDINWSLNSILKFVQFQKDRVNKKEISGATVRNYVKSIKLFCEMADMPIPWKKITRGLPKGKNMLMIEFLRLKDRCNPEIYSEFEFIK